MEKTFYLFRHGQTPFNASGIWQGTSSNPDLDGVGQEQATALAVKLKGCNIREIYSSPALRALRTAAIVSQALQVPVTKINNLHECSFGDAEGRTMEEIKATWPQLMHDILHPTPSNWDCRYPGENSESKHQVFDRVSAALLEIAQQSPFNVIGISTHGGVMSAMLAGLGSYGLELPNCCVAEIVCIDKKMQFIRML